MAIQTLGLSKPEPSQQEIAIPTSKTSLTERDYLVTLATTALMQLPHSIPVLPGISVPRSLIETKAANMLQSLTEEQAEQLCDSIIDIANNIDDLRAAKGK